MSDEKKMPILQTPQVRTWELNVNINGPLESQEISDWPSHIQDQIYAALEHLADRVQLPITIIAAKWDIDYGEANDGSQDQCYIMVVASEIVAKDVGFGQRKDEALQMMQRMFNEQMKRPN